MPSCFFRIPTMIKGCFAPGLCSFANVLWRKQRACSLLFLFSQLGQLFGFSPFQSLLEDEQVDIDDVI